MERKSDESERFDLYLSKTFNKTASLIAYTCKANAILAAGDNADRYASVSRVVRFGTIN